MTRLETTYHNILRSIFAAVNPVKKVIIKTECQVHKYINFHALNILKNDKYLEEHSFFQQYMEEINKGAVWADQDFKSSNHFYNPYKKKMVFMEEAMPLPLRWITMLMQCFPGAEEINLVPCSTSELQFT
ncbi:MAG: phospholipase zinc-binding protein [Bacillota bacterium]|nr:phospholipase zinc-binding protein [Bacillota bacterium]